MPQVVTSAFSSQVVHSVSSSLGMGIEDTNTDGLLGISQQIGDELVSIPSSSRTNMITNSQGVAFQSAQVGSQPTGDTCGIELAANLTNCGRGPSRGPNLKPERPLILDFNEEMQPIGPNRMEFMKYLGKLACSGIRFPLIYEVWNDILEDTLDTLWKDVQAIATCLPAYKTNCMSHLMRNGEVGRAF